MPDDAARLYYSRAMHYLAHGFDTMARAAHFYIHDEVHTPRGE